MIALCAVLAHTACGERVRHVTLLVVNRSNPFLNCDLWAHTARVPVLAILEARLLCSMAMQSQSPRLLVLDDDRAIMLLVGAGVTCLDVLKALREMSPQCEVALMTGYSDLDGAVETIKRALDEQGLELEGALRGSLPAGRHHGATAPLVQVEREHIIRTLEQVRGNKAVAARILGISRRAFYRQLERHGLHQRVPMSRRQEPTPAAME